MSFLHFIICMCPFKIWSLTKSFLCCLRSLFQYLPFFFLIRKQYRLALKYIDWFEFRLCHVFCAWPWASYITTLCLICCGKWMLNICTIIVIMLKGCCGDLVSEYIHKPIEQFLTHSKCSVKIMLLLSLLFLFGSVLVLRTFFHHIFLNSFTPWICMMLVYHVLTSMLWIFWNLTFTILKIKKPFGLYLYGSSLAVGSFSRC